MSLVPIPYQGGLKSTWTGYDYLFLGGPLFLGTRYKDQGSSAKVGSLQQEDGTSGCQTGHHNYTCLSAYLVRPWGLTFPFWGPGLEAPVC